MVSMLPSPVGVLDVAQPASNRAEAATATVDALAPLARVELVVLMRSSCLSVSVTGGVNGADENFARWRWECCDSAARSLLVFRATSRMANNRRATAMLGVSAESSRVVA